MLDIHLHKAKKFKSVCKFQIYQIKWSSTWPMVKKCWSYLNTELCNQFYLEWCLSWSGVDWQSQLLLLKLSDAFVYASPAFLFTHRMLHLSIYYIYISTYISTPIYISTSMYLYIYIYISTYISTPIYLHLCIYIYIYISISTPIYLYIYIRISTYISISTPIYPYIYISVCVCVYIRYFM